MQKKITIKNNFIRVWIKLFFFAPVSKFISVFTIKIIYNNFIDYIKPFTNILPFEIFPYAGCVLAQVLPLPTDSQAAKLQRVFRCRASPFVF